MTPDEELTALAATPDEELLAQALAQGVDVEGMVERQREWVRRKMEEARQRYERGQ